MKYTIMVETMQLIDAEAENEEAAIAQVKSKLDPRVAEAARFSIVYQVNFDEESKTYKLF